MQTATDKAAAVQSIIAHSTGSDHYVRHWSGKLYTSGVESVAEAAGAYWLIDAIFSHQSRRVLRLNRRMQEFQLWTLKVKVDHSAVLTCREDSDCPAAVTQRIEYTDFPLPEIQFYVEGGVLLLPSEH